MTTSNCSSCAALQHPHRIRSRAELHDAVKVVQGEIEIGTLSETQTDVPRREWQTSFSDLREGGTLDDIVVCYFRCTACARLFCLSCETYHGSGGGWAMVEDQATEPGVQREDR
jgi:hypothetical protein